MSMIEQYPARPECVYGTREFEERRKARMAASRKPVRRVSEDVVQGAPFAGLRGAVAHYDAVRQRIATAHLRLAKVAEPEPTPAAPEPEAVTFWVAPVDDIPAIVPQPEPEAEPTTEAAIAERDWLLLSAPVRVRDILLAVAAYYKMTVAELLARRRHPKLIRCKQVAMYLAKTMTARSFPDIGRRFGGMDHSTIIHGVRKIECLIAVERELADDVEAIKHLIHSRALA